jgi:hypothetical protein
MNVCIKGACCIERLEGEVNSNPVDTEMALEGRSGDIRREVDFKFRFYCQTQVSIGSLWLVRVVGELEKRTSSDFGTEYRIYSAPKWISDF